MSRNTYSPKLIDGVAEALCNRSPYSWEDSDEDRREIFRVDATIAIYAVIDYLTSGDVLEVFNLVWMEASLDSIMQSGKGFDPAAFRIAVKSATQYEKVVKS